MTPKERVQAALQHRQADHIPVYFGGTSSFLSDVAYENLKQYLGISGTPDPYRKGHTGTIHDPRILDALGVDVRFLVYNLENYGVREFVSEDRIIDEWGIPIVKSGEHWSRVEPPLADASAEEIAEYRFPTPDNNPRNEGLEAQAKEYYEKGQYALVARSVHSSSFLEYGCWLRGYEDSFCDLVTESDEAHILLDKVLDAQIAFYRDFLGRVGPYVDIVETSEDYGTQNSLFLSPETYRTMIQPRRRKLNEVIRSYAPNAKILHHSCGAIRKLIPDLIDSGIDILNPVQPFLPGMDAMELKAEFGDKVCFCGGIDMQHAINGSFDDIERDVARCAEAFGHDGGYLFCTSNHVQSDTPPENVVKLFETFHKY